MTARQLSKLAVLLNRVRLATTRRGKKSELARYMGEPPQRVNDWLSGGRAPGGEVTLLMLEWVTAEEAQTKKYRGSAINTATAKTRQLQSDYEKSKRVRKK